jgi:hypothetical protein
MSQMVNATDRTRILMIAGTHVTIHFVNASILAKTIVNIARISGATISALRDACGRMLNASTSAAKTERLSAK